MIKKLFRAGLASAIFTLFVAPAYASVREDVAELMEHVRKQEVVDNSAVLAGPPLEVLTELRNYLADPNHDVRMMTLSLAIGVLQRHSTDQKIRQQVADFLVTVAKSDPESSIAGYAAGIPYTFSPHLLRADFTDVMRQDILKLVNRENPRTEFIFLAGVADVQSAKEQLWELAKKDMKAAYLALARMGDKAALEHVLDEHNRVVNVAQLWKDMGYIRQPASVEILIRYLFSEKKFPSEDIRYYPGTPYALYVLDVLTQIIEGFPIESKGPTYSDAELQIAREWITAHRDKLKIKR